MNKTKKRLPYEEPELTIIAFDSDADGGDIITESPDGPIETEILVDPD